MLKQEFISRLPKGTKLPTDQEYTLIEKVYLYHPSIDDVQGKDQIALIYTSFGLSVIRDMLPRAEVVEKLEKDLIAAKRNVRRIEDLINSIKEGGEI